MIVLSLIVSSNIFAGYEYNNLAKEVIPVIEFRQEKSVDGNYYLTQEQADAVVALQDLQVVEKKDGPETITEHIDCLKESKNENSDGIQPEDKFEIVMTVQSAAGKKYTSEQVDAFSQDHLSKVGHKLKSDMMHNPDSWKSILSSNADKLSVEEKFSLIAIMGGIFSKDYNRTRLDLGLSEHSEVSMKMLLERSMDAKKGTGGVCRDVIQAQLGMARELGVKGCYGVAYSSKGLHTNLICKHPDQKGKFIRINYKFDGVVTGQGSEVLTVLNNQPNKGLYTIIFNDKGETVKTIPLEMAKIFRSVTGSENEESANYSIAKIKVKSGKNTYTAFKGKTSSHNTVRGLAYSRKLTEDTEFGMAYGEQELNLKGEARKVKTGFARLYTDKSLINSKLGNTDIELAVVSDIDFEITSLDGKNTFMGNTAPFSAELRSETPLTNDIKLSTVSSINLGVGTKNVSISKADKIYLNEGKQIIKVTKSFVGGELYAVAEYAHSEISNTFVVAAGYRNGAHLIQYRKQGALDSSTPLFIPEAAKKDKIRYSFKESNTRYFIEYTQDEFSGDGYNAGVEVKFK